MTKASLNLTQDSICIRGAREHNLQNLSLDIPRNCFVVVTGVSGSGKSTLAFDLLFAEGQRRFLDCMNTYARQFVQQLARPDVDLITGIPPSVSIEQRNSRGGGKSTVATVTEIYHFIRLLFARLGTTYCPDCQAPVGSRSRDQLGQQLKEDLRKRSPLVLLAPVVKGRKGFHTEVAEWAARHGFEQVRADGRIHDVSQPLRLDRFREHDVEIVIGEVSRSTPPVEMQAMVDQAVKLGQGTFLALDRSGRSTVHSTQRTCPDCGRSFLEIDPKLFSYNSSTGWCPSCRGFGELFYLPDVDRGARADAIEESWYEWQEGRREPCPECHGARLNPLARAVRLRLPLRSPLPFALTPPGRERNGEAHMAGGHSTSSPQLNIDTIARLSVSEALELFQRVRFAGVEAEISRDILPEIRERLQFLDLVGLGYMELGRGIPTLSSGEAQRIRLAAQLGSNLTGILYVLDEPTIGLHARDNERLLNALTALRSRGNSLVVVEHDEETMRRADYIIDLGPGAGRDGGRLVAGGTLEQILKHPNSLTGQFLGLRKKYPSRGEWRPVTPFRLEKPVESGGNSWLILSEANRNNLKDLTVAFPLQRLVVVTGVSGSGKSTLIRECLMPALEDYLKGRASGKRGVRVAGTADLQAFYEVDQAPIGRTPRSIPATYVGFFDAIRRLFSELPEARLRGYSPSRFSFNSSQGRCPECEGAGAVKVTMNFLPPAFVPCQACGGGRFNRETLDVLYGGKSIAQVLDLSVAEAVEFFGAITSIRRPLQVLCDAGLGYVKLGQTSPTLSGGEAQRLKLVTHLLTGISRPEEPDLRRRMTESKAKHKLFILEEPTIGLHAADVLRLLKLLHRLVDGGHSVIVIEHHLDLIADADWVIDLGPEAGKEGGEVVAQGAPRVIAANKMSHTGRALRKILR